MSQAYSKEKVKQHPEGCMDAFATDNTVIADFVIVCMFSDLTNNKTIPTSQIMADTVAAQGHCTNLSLMPSQI